MAINFLDEEEFDLDNASTFQFDDDLFSDSRVKDDSIISSYDFFKMNLGAGLENFNELYDSYMPDFLADAGRALYESGAEGLEDYYPEYPSGLYSANDKLGWVLERTAEGATTNAGLLLASGISQNLMRSPMPLTKAFGVAGQAGTFGMNWLLQFNENVGVHTANANKTLSEFDAGERGRLFGASTINALLDQLPRNFAIKGTGNKSYNKKSIKEIYERFNKAEKQEFVQSMMVFAKRAMGTSFREMLTETGQTTVSELTSATGIEGLKSGEELASAAAVGAAGGVVMGSGPAGIEAGSFNRQLKKDEKILNAANLESLQEAGKEFGTGVENYEKQYQELVDSYKGPELDAKIKELAPVEDVIPDLMEFEKLDKSSLSKLGTNFGDMLLNRSTDMIERQRANTKTGEAYYRLNRSLKSFAPSESGTGEFQDNLSFESLKNNNIGEFVVPFANIKDKWEQSFPLIGKFASKIGTNIDKYFGQALENKIDPALEAEVRKQLGNRFKELRKDVADTRKNFNKVRNSLAKALGKDGLRIGFIKDYLTRGIDTQAVQANPKGFLDALKNDVVISPTRDPKTKEIIETAKEVRERILNDILNGVNPSMMTSEQIRKVKTRTGKARPTFEKARDGKWDKLPEEFRKKSSFDSVNEYMMNASTRLASADAFGANSANRLNDDINYLLENKVIGNQDAEKMWDLYDAVHNTYRKPQDEAGRTRQDVMRAVATVATVKYLGMATISSITEPAWIIQRNGIVNTLKAAPTMAVHVLAGIKRSLYSGGVGKEATSNFARDLIRLTGFALDPKNTERNQKMFAGDNNPSSLITKYTSAFFRMPAGGFLTQYTNFVRGWAGVAAIKRIESEAKALKRMKPARRKRLEAELAENGMTLEDFASIYRAGNNKIDILNENFLNATIVKSNGTQTRVRDLMLPYLRKMITDVALQPEATNRPLWMSNPDMQLLSQLKSFPILFGNTVAKRVIRKMNPKSCTPDLMGQMSTLAAIGTALAMAALAMAIKDEIRGSEREHGPIDLIGAIGIPLVGETSLSGYIGGPAVGMIDDLLSSLYGEGMAETLAKTPEEFFNIILRATTGAIGAEAFKED